MTNAEIAILEILDRNHCEMYGLDIIEQSNHELKIATIYVWTKRLEDRGLITSRPEDEIRPEIGLARRLYKITEDGKRALLHAQTSDGNSDLTPNFA